MDVLLFLVSLVVMGFVLGSLARFALPGPDPLPVWQTIALGIAGSFLGGVIAGLLGLGADTDTGSLAGSFLAALIGTTLLLFLYRRFVQGRTLTGPRAGLRERQRP